MDMIDSRFKPNIFKQLQASKSAAFCRPKGGLLFNFGRFFCTFMTLLGLYFFLIGSKHSVFSLVHFVKLIHHLTFHERLFVIALVPFCLSFLIVACVFIGILFGTFLEKVFKRGFHKSKR